MAYVVNQVSVSDEDSTPVPRMDNPNDLVPCPSLSPVPLVIPSEGPDVNSSLEWDKHASLGELTITLHDIFSDSSDCTNTLQHDF